MKKLYKIINFSFICTRRSFRTTGTKLQKLSKFRVGSKRIPDYLSGIHTKANLYKHRRVRGQGTFASVYPCKNRVKCIIYSGVHVLFKRHSGPALGRDVYPLRGAPTTLETPYVLTVHKNIGAQRASTFFFLSSSVIYQGLN